MTIERQTKPWTVFDVVYYKQTMARDSIRRYLWYLPSRRSFKEITPDLMNTLDKIRKLLSGNPIDNEKRRQLLRSSPLCLCTLQRRILKGSQACHAIWCHRVFFSRNCATAGDYTFFDTVIITLGSTEASTHTTECGSSSSR
ncbi:hypothetical protein CEXT_588571 [Caerostris extrusa]|uniref:Uncharacterized protein n=1 Tax=Caerostris extrusa TaxID=172846 RepID=A0AAV4TEL1_CAEEX|nr:hypothetical protein CEXT_588571 [Caerostris extrusa]